MSLHDGHRARLDKKVMEHGIECLATHEKLEYLLFAVIPRGDTNAIAHRLLERFSTISGVINADVEVLTEIPGVGRRTARFLTSLPEILRIVERETAGTSHPYLDSPEAISRFAKTFFHGKLTESVYIFSLNSKRKLLSCTLLTEGRDDNVEIVPAQAAKRALLDNAEGVILAHNHPCGSMNASLEDMMLTTNLISAFRTLGIELVDCIVVTGGVCKSIIDGYDWDYINKHYKGR